MTASASDPGSHPRPSVWCPPLRFRHPRPWLSPQVIEEQPVWTAASLVGGTLVGSAWTHGLLQVGCEGRVGGW
jgi:hypothetical protein